ncbi:MAG: DUF305 domain-containing protein [Candidatus Methylomirabilales bacterium]
MIRGLAAGALLMVWVTASAAVAQQAPDGHGQHAAPPRTAGAAAGMHAAMAKMAKDMDAIPLTGDPDRDFLAMMIPHHAGAVEMARLVLIHGHDPVVRRLAEDVIATQQAEIVTMRNRLQTLRAGPDLNPGGFPALGGTRGPGRALKPGN